jgi:hypothetical protein
MNPFGLILFRGVLLMLNNGIVEKKQLSFFGIFLLLLGIGGMIYTAVFDFFKAGLPSFGIDQLAGFVISAILALAGLRKIAILRARIWDVLLLVVYFAGILFMGLKSEGSGYTWSKGMLQDLTFHASDVIANFLGFIPFSYLTMSFLIASQRVQKISSAVYLTIATCGGISLLIELSQHFIPGRISSILDLFFNGLGVIVGIIYCLLENRKILFVSRQC